MNNSTPILQFTVYIPAHAGESPELSDTWIHPQLDSFRVTVGAFGQATSWKVVPEGLIRFQALSRKNGVG